MPIQRWSRLLGLTRDVTNSKALLPWWLYAAYAVAAAILIVIMVVLGVRGRIQVGVFLLAALIAVLLLIAVLARRGGE